MSLKHMTITLLLLLSLYTILGPASALAAEAPEKRTIALAVHLDDPKRDWPGFSGLQDKIIETLLTKLNSMVVNQIISGTGVMEKLKEYGVENLESADVQQLRRYGRQNNIGYIILFTLRPGDLSYNLKAFDVAKGSFLYDGTAVQPKEDNSWSLGDLALSPTQFFMKKVVPTLDTQLTALLKVMNE